MLQTTRLTSQQIDTFANDGFMVARSMFSPDAVKVLDTWARELIALPEVSGRQWVYHEKS